MKNIPSNYRGIVFILISTTCFSVVNLVVKHLQHIPTQELIFFRSLVSLIIGFVAIRHLKLSFIGNNIPWLLVRGFSGVVALTLFFYTLQKMPLANAVVIQYTSPVFTAFLGVFLLKEKVKPVQWLLYVVAIAGILLIKGFDSRITWLQLGLGIVSALFAGLAYNAIRRLKDTDHPYVVVFYFPMIALPIMGVWSYFHWVTPHGIEWVLLLVMGVLTQIAQVNMTKALHADRAARVTPFKYFGAILAVAFGYTLFDETLTIFNFIGIGLIVIGVIFNSFVKH